MSEKRCKLLFLVASHSIKVHLAWSSTIRRKEDRRQGRYSAWPPPQALGHAVDVVPSAVVPMSIDTVVYSPNQVVGNAPRLCRQEGGVSRDVAGNCQLRDDLTEDVEAITEVCS